MAEHHPRVQLLSDPNAFSKDGPLSPDVVPHVLPLQILQIGNIFVLGVPAEFTSMAGMILRENVRKFLEENNVENPVVTIAGLSNAYSQYVTTPLEYDSQVHVTPSSLAGVLLPFLNIICIATFTFSCSSYLLLLMHLIPLSFSSSSSSFPFLFLSTSFSLSSSLVYMHPMHKNRHPLSLSPSYSYYSYSSSSSSSSSASSSSHSPVLAIV
jgi:hypothetical protein